MSVDQTKENFRLLESLTPVSKKCVSNRFVGVYEINGRYFEALGFYASYLGLTIESFKEVWPKKQRVIEYV